MESDPDTRIAATVREIMPAEYGGPAAGRSALRYPIGSLATISMPKPASPT